MPNCDDLPTQLININYLHSMNKVRDIFDISKVISIANNYYYICINIILTRIIISLNYALGNLNKAISLQWHYL